MAYTIRKIFRNPIRSIKIICDNVLRIVAPCIRNDELYIRLKWWCCQDYRLSINSPRSFNEKLQWLKLHDRRPIYTTMVDKVEAKDYVASIIGQTHIIPTIGVWDSPKDIDWDSLPDRFVLKCNGDSASVVVCKDKTLIDRDQIVRRLEKNSNRNYFYLSREWPYKDVSRRVLAEQFIEEEGGGLKDFKLFCFNGKVKCYKIDFDRFTNHRANYYNREGELLPFGEKDYPPDNERFYERPQEMNQMILLAEKLSQNIPFVRVDFYFVKSVILFGEMTFFPAGGFGQIVPEEWDYKMGEWLKLPSNN